MTTSLQDSYNFALNKIEANLILLANDQASSRLSLTSFTDQLIAIQNQIETIKQLFPALMFAEDSFTTLFNCQKRLLKLQSKAIKLASATIQDKQGLYLKISEVWSRTVYRFGTDVELGMRLWENHAKDQLNLQGLSEYLHKENQKKIDQIIKLSKEGNWQEAIEIANSFSQALPEPLAEALRTKTTYLEQAAFFPPATLNVKPFFCSNVSVQDVEKLELCESDQYKASFYNLLFRKISRLFNQAPEDAHFLHRFIRQNREHPIVHEAIEEFILETFLNPFIFLSGQSLLDHVHTLPEFLQYEIYSELNNSIYQTHLNPLIIASEYNSKISLTDENSARPTTLEAAFKKFTESLKRNILNLQRFANPKQITFYPDLFYYIEVIGNVENSKYFQSALRALIHSLGMIEYSTNYLNRENTHFNLTKFKPQELSLIGQYALEFQESIKKQDENLILLNCDCINSKQKFIEGISINCTCLGTKNIFLSTLGEAKNAKYSRIGNCGELTDYCFYYLLKEKNPQLTIETVWFDDEDHGDHGFLIIGRSHDSDFSDHTTWGSETIVVDSWARKIYLASDLMKILKNYIDYNEAVGLPVLEKFDPNLHELDLYASNFVSPNELADVDLSNFSKEEIEAFEIICNLHQAFFESADRAEQKRIARDILMLLDKDQNIHFFLTKETITLRSQMQFFLTSKVGKKAQIILKEML